MSGKLSGVIKVASYIYIVLLPERSKRGGGEGVAKPLGHI